MSRLSAEVSNCWCKVADHSSGLVHRRGSFSGFISVAKIVTGSLSFSTYHFITI